jgi:hypothetical protein
MVAGKWRVALVQIRGGRERAATILICIAAGLEDASYALAYPGIWSLIFCSSASSEMPWKS